MILKMAAWFSQAKQKSLEANHNLGLCCICARSNGAGGACVCASLCVCLCILEKKMVGKHSNMHFFAPEATQLEDEGVESRQEHECVTGEAF